jgi:acetylornithine/N-succinyldiaminopimelate aminotransferase
MSSPFLVQNYGRQPVTFVRGAGCRLWDDQGRRYLDAFAGVAVSALGHAHPKVTAAIASQAATLVHVSNHYQINEQERLAATLVPAAFPGQVLFCNTGTEANECAYKALRLWSNTVHGGRKPRTVAFTGGFHGRTMGALSWTHTPAYREPFAPNLPCDFVPFGDLAALEAAMGDDVAGVVAEPVQGEGGVFPAPAGFLAGVRALCDKHGALLVMDEVQTGVGRTGTAFGFQQDGIVPDIMTLAKGLGGGIPIGAVVMAPQVAALFKPGLHGTTFGGNPLACATAQVVVDTVLVPAFLARVVAAGERLRAGLQRAFPGRTVRGRGLLLGVQLDAAPGPLVTAAREQGVIVGPAGNNTLRLAPPLIISDAEIDELCAALAKAREVVGG